MSENLVFYAAVALVCLGLNVWHTSLTRETWPNRAARWAALKLGYTPLYWTDSRDPNFRDKVWTHRYDDIDGMMTRPIHAQMSVAPPWAKLHWVKSEDVAALLGHETYKKRLLKRFKPKETP